MDCEMVGVGFDGLDSMLARVTIVDWNRTVLLDYYVRPTQPVVDYRTHVSGIVPAHLESDAAVDFFTCQRDVCHILRNKILIGHGLTNDLTALRISHPLHMIRDTATYGPFMKARRYANDATTTATATVADRPLVLWPRKLKELCWEYLDHCEIQAVGRPHSPVEDAVAALNLYQSVQDEWENMIRYNEQQQRLRLQYDRYHHHHHHQQQQQQQQLLLLQYQQQQQQHEQQFHQQQYHQYHQYQYQQQQQHQQSSVTVPFIVSVQ